MELCNKSDSSLPNNITRSHLNDLGPELQSSFQARVAVTQQDTDLKATTTFSQDPKLIAVARLSPRDVSSGRHPCGPSESLPDGDEISGSRNQTLDEEAAVLADKKGSTVAHETERHDPGSTPSLYRKLQAKCRDHWVWEILACVLAVACLVAIIIILALRQNHPVPNWPNMISINSWVSIFTAIMKAAIMLPVGEGISQLKWLWFKSPRPLMDMEEFDSATRGPWGALLLLFSLRGHHLASLGAFITVMALAIDAFSQQIIYYYNCFPVAPNILATIPRTNNYTRDGITIHPGNAEPNEAVTTAITLGALDLPANESSLIPFSCPSGNCTFPSSGEAAFQTLGMCHTCKEINDLIRVNDTYPGYWLENWEGEPSWQWTDQPALVGYAFPNTTFPYSMFWSRKTLALDPAFDDLITFDWLMLNVDSNCNIEESQDCQKHPWAETVLSTVPLRKTNNSAVEITTSTNLTFSLVTDKILRDGTWTQCKFSIEPTVGTPLPTGINNTLAFDNPNPGSPLRYYEPDCVWSLGYFIGLGLNQWMSWIYGSEYLQASTESTFETTGSEFIKPLYRNGTATIGSTNDYLLGLTDTLTATMRQRGDSGRDQWATGNVLQSRTCIGVKWLWISLPTLIVFLSIAFMIATAFRSSYTDMWAGAWKSSAVAPILAGLNSNVGYIAGDASRNSEIERTAEHLRVRVFTEESRLEVT